MDRTIPTCTLFLHEDIMMRTLAYEEDLRKWRIAELEAGRPDLGRPLYDEVSDDFNIVWCHVSPMLQVFGGMRVTQHRFHCTATVAPFSSAVDYDDPHSADPFYHFYHSRDCPGIDNPDSLTPLPVIDTLLSIPFSLLHNHTRLSAMLPQTSYQKQLVYLSQTIINLWFWNPSPCLIAKSIAIRKQNCATGQQIDTPNPKPYPIHHPSRSQSRYSAKIVIDFNAQRIPTYGTLMPCSSHSLNLDKHTVEHPAGPVFLGIPTRFAPGTDEIQVTVADEIPVTVTDELYAANGEDDGLLKHVDGGFIAGITGSPLTSEAWSDTDDLDDTVDIKVIEDKIAIGPSSSDIVLWYQKVMISEPVLVLEPLIPTPFERGVIASMSVNDVLMARGLINPLVYIQFDDLVSFHREAAHA